MKVSFDVLGIIFKDDFHFMLTFMLKILVISEVCYLFVGFLQFSFILFLIMFSSLEWYFKVAKFSFTLKWFHFMCLFWVIGMILIFIWVLFKVHFSMYHVMWRLCDFLIKARWFIWVSQTFCYEANLSRLFAFNLFVENSRFLWES